MRQWHAVPVWCVNILVISFVLAVFEILLEKNNGWGSGLNPHGWGRKVFEGTFVARISEKPYFTVYHIFMFAAVVPTCLIVEYSVARALGVVHAAYSNILGTSNSYLVAQVDKVHFMPFLYFVSVWFAIVFVEDFLWFVMNWYYPNSLQALFSGNVWWHKRWISLGTVKVPRFYLWSFVLSVTLLSVCLYLAA